MCSSFSVVCLSLKMLNPFFPNIHAQNILYIPSEKHATLESLLFVSFNCVKY